MEKSGINNAYVCKYYNIKMMKFSILTLFPNFFTSPLQESIVKRAIEKKQISVETINIRDFADNAYKRIDAKPFGGGAGMLMQAEPIARAIESIENWQDCEVIFFTPSAPELTQKESYELAKRNTHKIFLCGHYEGVDERVIQKYVHKQFSIGKTVLTGGEIPALFCLDSIVRLLPNVIAKEISHERETFSTALYEKGEYPQFTRPEKWRGIEVPKVLLSGNHSEIEKYQFEHLKNCTLLEKKIILFREKFKNKKIQLSKYSRIYSLDMSPELRSVSLELLPYSEENGLYVLEWNIEKISEDISSVSATLSIDLYSEEQSDGNLFGDGIAFILQKVISSLCN